MSNTTHLHFFCGYCGNSLQNETNLFSKGIVSCPLCGKTRQFRLDKTNINPAPGDAVKMIGKHNVASYLDGAYSSELQIQGTRSFPDVEYIPLTTLITILRGLIEENTIYVDESLRHIYELLSQPHIFSMLVKMYRELNPSLCEKSPTEVIAN